MKFGWTKILAGNSTSPKYLIKCAIFFSVTLQVFDLGRFINIGERDRGPGIYFEFCHYGIFSQLNSQNPAGGA